MTNEERKEARYPTYDLKQIQGYVHLHNKTLLFLKQIEHWMNTGAPSPEAEFKELYKEYKH
jgi:hypothetical protein